MVDRKHGFAVLAFCGWLLWRDRQRLLANERGVGLALIPVAYLTLMWLVSMILNVQVGHLAAVPLLLLAWLLAVAGMGPFKAAAPVAALFFLGVPFWTVLVPVLQYFTVVANTLLLSLTGIEADIRGEYIAIASGVFRVARGCSGVGFLESGLVISFIYALLFLRSWKARAGAVLLGALLSIVSNWLRVFGLILLGHFTEMQSPIIADHYWYGWVIFGVTFVFFFWIVKYVERWDSELTSAAPTITSAPPKRVELTPRAVLVPSAVALVGPALLFFMTGNQRLDPVSDSPAGISPSTSWVREDVVVQRDNEAAFRMVLPRDSAERSAAEDTVGAAPVDSIAAAEKATVAASLADTMPWRPAYGDADEYRREVWRTGEKEVVVDRFLYEVQEQGKELINAYNVIASGRRVAGEGLVGPVNNTGRMVNTVAVRTQQGIRLVWYWYTVAGVDTHSRVEAKLLELAAFTRGGPPAEMVAVSTPCGPEDCSDAGRTLFTFVLGKEPPEPNDGSPRR